MRATLTLIAMLQIGCGAVLTTDRRDYAAGDTVALTLANRGSHTLGYNLCGAALERRDGAGWAPARYPGDGEGLVCEAVLLGLRVGAITHDALRLPAGLAAGEYRVKSGGEWMPYFWFARPVGRSRPAPFASNSFRVR